MLLPVLDAANGSARDCGARAQFDFQAEGLTVRWSSAQLKFAWVLALSARRRTPNLLPQCTRLLPAWLTGPWIKASVQIGVPRCLIAFRAFKY